MKKLVVVLLILFATSSVFAAPIDLGNFPLGRWLDPNWNVLWDFSSGNVRILSRDGGRVLYDFSTKTINDFQIGMDGMNPVISFSCPEAGRSYRFVVQFNGNLVMEIERPKEPLYKVELTKTELLGGQL